MIAMQKHGSKKGFFLTMMALAILSFMLLTAQVWLQTFEQSDIRAASRFKGESMRIALASISDKSFSDFANASAFFALNSLTLYASSDGQALVPKYSRGPDHPNPGTELVNESVYELMYNGTVKLSDSPNGILKYAKEDWQKYTMLSWQEKISKAANLTGFNVSFSPMKNFNISQDDPLHVRIYFEVDMNISDLEGTMRQSKTLKANSTFSLAGFLDPMVARSDMVHRGVPRSEATEKQVWFNTKYETPDDVKPVILADDEGTVFEGFGWFSGPVTQMYPDELNASDQLALKQYVLVDSFNEKMVQYRSAYGAIVIIGRPEIMTEPQGACTIERQAKCLNCMERRSGPEGCGDGSWDLHNDSTQIGSGTDAVYIPVMVTDDQSWLSTIRSNQPIKRFDTNPSQTDFEQEQATQYFVLFDNAADNPLDQLRREDPYYHRLWDVNSLRDMTTCGFYVAPGAASPTQGIAPSFFQRMIAGVETDTSLRSSLYGIESFVVGQWAGGKLETPPGAHDGSSRLDWEFYSDVPGTKIKGMPGCKYKTTDSIIGCTLPSSGDDKVLTEGVGRFGLSEGAGSDAMKRYGAEKISCDAPNSAAC